MIYPARWGSNIGSPVRPDVPPRDPTLCPCGADKRDNSPFCSDDCDPYTGLTFATAMRWWPLDYGSEITASV